MRTLLSFAILSALFLLVAPAGATSNFPASIQADLSLSAAPQCGLCHTTGGAGGRGTVNTPFGISVRGFGLVAYDTTSLKTALDAMKAAGTDSDGDCVPDITELKNGTDPNVPDSGKTCGSPVSQGDVPAYGCGAEVAPVGPAGAGLAWLGALGGACAAAVVRRRRSRPVP